MNKIVWIPAIAALLSSPFARLTAQTADPFAANVRTTNWLSAEDERKTFTVPPGFEIQLVASEPEIQKPMNLAFDSRGRLWVTSTIEYPFPVPLDKTGRDTIRVLEDTDGDGRADRVTTFADGLNIPIGVLPYKGGAIVWSIPYIWHLKDNDGDGKCDERVKLFGPLGWERDTHGMNNAFRRGFDGWLYACHGYNNETTIRGTDGHEVKMQSGNTYRLRLDGSGAEQFTWGQVNPFGMCFDALGNIYTADCHTKPIYVLFRGGYYPSFGKPDDGLGFVPEIMQHLHGSTANCGISMLTNPALPEAFRGNVLTGNVMTSRVNRDSLSWSGTTPTAKEETDFVITTDPWFRPVDIQEGPDGAVYVADFYNRIIGHYEVPLKHPGRDRTSGRIWRVVHRGDGKATTPDAKRLDLSKATAEELVAALERPVLSARLLAANELVDRLGGAAAGAVKAALATSKSATVRSHSLWILHRIGALTLDALKAAAADPDAAVRTHAMKVLAETAEWPEAHQTLALAGLRDADGFVARAAADALGQHPKSEDIGPLLEVIRKAPAADAHLRHAARIALRDQLRDAEGFRALAKRELDEADSRQIASAASAVTSPEAGAFLLRHLQKYAEPNDVLTRYLRHAARFANEDDTDSLARLARQKLASDVDLQIALLSSIQDGFDQRGLKPRKSLEEWASSLAREMLESIDPAAIAWRNEPVEGKRPSINPWALEKRSSADGKTNVDFISSLPRGEDLTGALRSRPFTIPPKLAFFLAGHGGFPDKPFVARSFVRLRASETGEVLREVVPPRNDVAQKVEWDLSAVAARQGFLELIDGDEGDAYAWIAAGRFEPAVVRVPSMHPNLVAEREKAAASLAARLKLAELRPRLEDLLASEWTEPPACESIAQALISIQPSPEASALVPIVSDASVSAALRHEAASAVLSRDAAAARAVLREAVRTSPARLQATLAQSLASSKPGAELLLELIQAGLASPRLLRSPNVKEKIAATELERGAERVDALTADLAPESEARDSLIAARRKAYRDGTPSIDKGAEVFVKSCAACHQIGGKGKIIGPQLDGIGNRGIDRVLEDVLDPNRNVDVMFRTTALVLKDGKVVTGLFRRQEGKSLILADVKGDEVSVPEDEVAEKTQGELSLMPDNVGDVVPEQDFSDLIAYLLASRGKP